MKTLEYEPHVTARHGVDALIKVAVVLLSVIGGLPAAILLHTYACYFSAAHYIGYFPTYAHPDPGTLPSNVLFGDWLMPFGFVLTVTIVPVLCLYVFCSRITQLSVAFGCAALLWILLISDPGGAWNWKLD